MIKNEPEPSISRQAPTDQLVQFLAETCQFRHPEYSYFTFEGEERDFRDVYWDVKDGDVVFDVGASYGTYTLSARAMGATVYSFEPEKIIRDFIEDLRRIRHNELCYNKNAKIVR